MLQDKPGIFVHLDWFADSQHSHQLSPAAIRAVVEAFAAAPFVSKTGSVGINLHVDQGPSSILDHATNRTWGALSRANQLQHVDRLGVDIGDDYDWHAFQGLKDAHFTPTGRAPVFRYAIAAHYYGNTCSSGISRGIGGSDFIVSSAGYDGGVASTIQQARTFMHELGHNLGLRHGGSDDLHGKPNYLSTMN
ncbi:zinc-dependent metalloprotease family protein [Lentzea sp. NPDC005914]|uniref:zinc-dependent metalloprotease family protein n=1 Tax=Lentzea sp. NPDC005914 TaxID=3154572 RepID=UPI0033F0F42B